MQEVQETWVRSLGQENPLEKRMATNSSILAWRIPWTEGPGGCSPWGHKESNMTEQLNNNSNYHIYCLETISLLSKSKWKKKKRNRCGTQADFYHARNGRNLGKKCKIMQVFSMQVFVLENTLVFITLKKLVILVFFREPDLIS